MNKQNFSKHSKEKNKDNHIIICYRYYQSSKVPNVIMAPSQMKAHVNVY